MNWERALDQVPLNLTKPSRAVIDDRKHCIWLGKHNKEEVAVLGVYGPTIRHMPRSRSSGLQHLVKGVRESDFRSTAGT